MITGIIVALPEEISSLTHKKVNKGDCIFINDKTLLTCSGAGPKNATNASLLLIKKGAKRLISWGCAAALKAELKSGDLILPKNLQSEKQETISIESPWLTHVLDHLSDFNPLTGLLAESHFIIAKSSEKQTIHTQSGAIALDMESVAIVKVAKKYNFPALVIRSIADPVTMSLPKAVSYALNSQGDIILSKLLWFLLTHPNELPVLIKLGTHFKAAKIKLKLISKQLDIIISFEQKTVIK
ncbi:MAG: phosphorylase [Methylococcaceae bacterium]|nr:phosphorylase [Methylococcaceae bacterium]